MASLSCRAIALNPSTEREIKVVTAFADQAVIAIGARERESQMARQARSAEQALELLAGVSKAASSATDLHSLALDCLAQSGKAAGCQFGQLWTPEPDGDLIRCMAKDYFGDRFAEFHSWSVQRSLEEGGQKHSRGRLAKPSAALGRGSGVAERLCRRRKSESSRVQVVLDCSNYNRR